MAIERTIYSINLDIAEPNCRFPHHFLQGSDDANFKITILKNGVEQTIDDGTEVKLVIMYGMSNACGPKVGNKGQYTLEPTDTDYDTKISIQDGKLLLQVDKNFTNSSGDNVLFLNISNTITANTYSMIYTVDSNPAYQPQSVPDNLPTFLNVEAKVKKIETQQTTNTRNISANTGNIANINKEITDIKAKGATHGGDILKVKQDITSLKNKDNLLEGDINDLSADIQQHNLDIPQLKNEVKTNKDTINTKANADMSNVGDFAAGTDGDLFYKKDGKLKVAPLEIDDDNKELQSLYSLVVPPNSIRFGTNTEIHENGGQLEYKTNSLNKNYIILGYENDSTTGSKKPVYWERGAKETKVDIQPVDNTAMNNINVINLGNPTFNRQVQKIYFKLINAVTNLKIKLNINGNDVADYPTGSWDDNTMPGFNVGNNLQTVSLLPFWSSLTNYNIKIYLKADSDISMFGNGTLPYVAMDINRIIKKDIALMDDITTGGGDTATGIRNKLQSLTGDDRLDASAVKNLPQLGIGVNEFTQLTDTPPTYTGAEGKYLAVKPTANGLEFVDAPINSPIPDADFLKQGKKVGFAENSLEDVDLLKLKEKVNDAGANLITVGQTHGDYRMGEVKEIEVHSPIDLTFDMPNKTVGVAINPDAYATKDVKNVLETDFDKKFKETQTYKIIWSRLPQLKGVKAKYIEKQQALTPDQFNVPEQIIHINYQIVGEDQIIQQTLPPVAIGKVLIIQMTFSTGIQNGSVILSPAIGEQFDGVSTSYTINEQGMAGTAFPETNNWDWIPFTAMNEVGIGVEDQRGNVFIGMDTVSYGAGFTATQDPTSKQTVKIDYDSVATDELNFVDGNTGAEFKANKIQSLDKSIRIAKIGEEIADFSLNENNEDAVLLSLNEDQTLNSAYNSVKTNFDKVIDKGDMYVYENLQHMSIVIQDISDDDPVKTDGTEFMIAMYAELKGVLTQDGKIAVYLEDDKGNIVKDKDGNDIYIEKPFKANDVLTNISYAHTTFAKGYTEVYMRIKPIFPTEELISVGTGTYFLVHALNTGHGVSNAWRDYMAFTGETLNVNRLEIGDNMINFASLLTMPEPKSDAPTGTQELGLGYFMHATSPQWVEIKNDYSLEITPQGNTLPNIVTVGRVLSPLNTFYMRGKDAEISVNINPDNYAFEVELMGYKGTTDEFPYVKSIIDDNVVYNDNWYMIGRISVNEDVTSGFKTLRHTVIIPEDVDKIALIVRNREDEVAGVDTAMLKLKDLELDMTPQFKKHIIKEHGKVMESITSRTANMYKAVTLLPDGDMSYRYTVNATPTKIPFGAIKPNFEIFNNNIWYDAGSYDPNKVQGDGEFKVTGPVKISYSGIIGNETGTENDVHIELAKVNGKQIATIPNSIYNGKISANTKKIDVTKPEFEFDVKNGESIRVLANSNIDDGFFFHTENPHLPLFEIIIEIDSIKHRIDVLEQEIKS